MKTILRLRRYLYLARVSIFLITVALIVGMVGCGTITIPLSVTISSTMGGSVMVPGEGTFTYCCSRVVNLVAVADEGYHFVEWTGDVSTIANVNAATTTITLNGQHFITANFAQDQPIRTWYDLDAVRNNLTGSYILMNDLNATSAGYTELASPTANGGKGWQPIGNTTNSFTGSFDGQGYEIKDLFIDRPEENEIGLFGWVGEGGIFKNVGVVEAVVTGSNFTGGLVGANGGAVSNSYFTGGVTGSEFVGGLVGANGGAVSDSYSTGNVTGSGEQQWLFVGGLVGASNGTVFNSYSTGIVTGTGTNIYLFVGGLVGNNHYGTVSNSYSTGNVTGSGSGQDSAFGGLVGINIYGTVSNSYSTGNVTGAGASNYTHVGGLVGASNGTVSNSYSTGIVTGSGHSFVGGLVGSNVNGGTVSNCYATGNVSGTWDVGGLVGYNHEGGTVSDSYSTGSVTGNVNVGGLAAFNDGTVTNSFWDIETSGQNISAGGTGKNTAEMQYITTFSGATWDITAVGGIGERNTGYIWNIVGGVTYPFLSWQPA
jgi:hypothetical protein